MRTIRTGVLLAIAIFALAACGSGKDKEKADREDDPMAGPAYNYTNFASSHVIAYQDSLLFFYNMEEDMTIPFHLQEPDEVFNFVFAPDGKTMYYTVVREGNLWLRRATFSSDGAKLEDLTNLKLTKQQCTLNHRDDRSRLEYSEGKVLISSDFSSEAYDFSRFHIYNIADGSLRTVPRDMDEYSKFYGRQMDQAPEGFETKSEQLLYSHAGRLVCLTDRMGIKSKLEDGDEIWFRDYMVSPDGSKVAFVAINSFVEFPEGPLCIANADGSQQRQLSPYGATMETPARWIGNELFFIDDDNEIVIP